MQLVPLPDFKEHPLDENTSAFIAAVSAARASDEEFITAMDEIDPNDLNSQEQEAKLERSLRDQVREMLGMPPHASLRFVGEASVRRLSVIPLSLAV